MAIAGALCVSVGVGAHDPVTTKVTWTHDIARLVEARCVGCHAPGGRGPMPLTSYEEARPWAKAIREEVLTRRMPKWHAARGYGEFANDPSLSPFEIALVAAWVDGGAPKGTPEPSTAKKTAPAPIGVRGKAGPTLKSLSRELKMACGSRPLAGRVLAVRPDLARGGSAGIAAVLPDGRREIVAWIRDYDPRFPTTYRLRKPIELPTGSRLVVETDGQCSLTVFLSHTSASARD
jgi:hypothetical protein